MTRSVPQPPTKPASGTMIGACVPCGTGTTVRPNGGDCACAMPLGAVKKLPPRSNEQVRIQRVFMVSLIPLSCLDQVPHIALSWLAIISPRATDPRATQGKRHAGIDVPL